MRAILCTGPASDFSTTQLTNVPVPEPGPGEIRVRVRAASINPVDWKLCAGSAPWLNDPYVVGLDAAGVVDALGEGVTNVASGDRVMWHGNLSRDGVFADYALTVAHVVSKLPDAVSFEAAAALPCAALTAYQALVRKIQVSEGDWVVVQGASGGVGGFGIQIAANLGANVIALAKPEHDRLARDFGAIDVIDYRDPDLAAKVRARTGGQGADAVLEVFNSGDARTSLEMLRFNGHYATTDPLPNLSNVEPYTYAASMHEVALGAAYSANHMPTQLDFAVMGDALLCWLAEGKLDPMITERITLEQVPEYLAKLRDRAFTGKAVVTL